MQLKDKAVSVIIPAAGFSARMGCDKALLPSLNGGSFAANLVRKYRESGVEKIVLVLGNQFDQSKLEKDRFEIVINDQPELGRSHSILLGMRKLQPGSNCFIHNIDNPFMEAGLFDALLGAGHDGSYTVPVCDGKGGHPVLIGSRIADYIRNCSEIPDFREILRLFGREEVSYPDKRILWNINTPRDYKKYLASAEPFPL